MAFAHMQFLLDRFYLVTSSYTMYGVRTSHRTFVIADSCTMPVSCACIYKVVVEECAGVGTLSRNTAYQHSVKHTVSSSNAWRLSRHTLFGMHLLVALCCMLAFSQRMLQGSHSLPLQPHSRAFSTFAPVSKTLLTCWHIWLP